MKTFGMTPPFSKHSGTAVQPEGVFPQLVSGLSKVSFHTDEEAGASVPDLSFTRIPGCERTDEQTCASVNRPRRYVGLFIGCLENTVEIRGEYKDILRSYLLPIAEELKTVSPASHP